MASANTDSLFAQLRIVRVNTGRGFVHHRTGCIQQFFLNSPMLNFRCPKGIVSKVIFSGSRVIPIDGKQIGPFLKSLLLLKLSP